MNHFPFIFVGQHMFFGRTGLIKVWVILLWCSPQRPPHIYCVSSDWSQRQVWFVFNLVSWDQRAISFQEVKAESQRTVTFPVLSGVVTGLDVRLLVISAAAFCVSPPFRSHSASCLLVSYFVCQRIKSQSSGLRENWKMSWIFLMDFPLSSARWPAAVSLCCLCNTLNVQ